MLDQTPVIAIEEHYWDFEMARHFPPGENKSHVVDPLLDLGESRLSSMDEAGIDRGHCTGARRQLVGAAHRVQARSSSLVSRQPCR